jgi:hemerythrin superfamily protein
MAQTQSTETRKSQELDIIDIIMEDHKMLKELIETLKDSETELEERQEAFDEFAPLLVTHAKPEEESLYEFMKRDDELRSEAFEGDVEHVLADQLLEEIQREEDSDMWSAKVKVLAELVEHHIEEEESELLPEFRKHSNPEERAMIAEQFIDLKTEMLLEGSDDSKPEADIEADEAEEADESGIAAH